LEHSALTRRPAPRISVIVPALNEAENLVHVLPRIPADVFEIVLVDGGSGDATVEVARTLIPDVRIVPQASEKAAATSS
jgi:glycosyltransferase involved in cell wall biosynthesis